MSIYAVFISFALVFITELGDKTQLLMISFSNKSTPFRILLGVAIGSFFSHGIAILFGRALIFLIITLSSILLKFLLIYLLY